jgi:hypothetical protein
MGPPPAMGGAKSHAASSLGSNDQKYTTCVFSRIRIFTARLCPTLR